MGKFEDYLSTEAKKVIMDADLDTPRHGLLEMNLFNKMLLFCNIFGPRVYRDFIYD